MWDVCRFWVAKKSHTNGWDRHTQQHLLLSNAGNKIVFVEMLQTQKTEN